MQTLARMEVAGTWVVLWPIVIVGGCCHSLLYAAAGGGGGPCCGSVLWRQWPVLSLKSWHAVITKHVLCNHMTTTSG